MNDIQIAEAKLAHGKQMTEAVVAVAVGLRLTEKAISTARRVRLPATDDLQGESMESRIRWDAIKQFLKCGCGVVPSINDGNVRWHIR